MGRDGVLVDLERTMKYVVLDITQIEHGDPIRIIGKIDDAGIARLSTLFGEVSHHEDGVVWLEEGGNIVAIPTKLDTLPNIAESWLQEAEEEGYFTDFVVLPHIGGADGRP